MTKHKSILELETFKIKTDNLEIPQRAHIYEWENVYVFIDLLIFQLLYL